MYLELLRTTLNTPLAVRRIWDIVLWDRTECQNFENAMNEGFASVSLGVRKRLAAADPAVLATWSEIVAQPIRAEDEDSQFE